MTASHRFILRLLSVVLALGIDELVGQGTHSTASSDVDPYLYAPGLQATLELMTEALMDANTSIMVVSKPTGAFTHLDKAQAGVSAARYLGAVAYHTVTGLRVKDEPPEVIFIRDSDWDVSLVSLGPGTEEYVPLLYGGNPVWLCFLTSVNEWPSRKRLDPTESARWLAEHDSKMPVGEAIKHLGLDGTLNSATWFEPYRKRAMFQLDLPAPELPPLKTHPLNRASFEAAQKAQEDIRRKLRSSSKVVFPPEFLADIKSILARLRVDEVRPKPNLISISTQQIEALKSDMKTDLAKQLLAHIRSRSERPQRGR